MLKLPLTLVDLLEHRSNAVPNKGYRFLGDGENETDFLSYSMLATRARAIATTLLQSAKRRDRVLLLYAPGLDFIAGFFGCLFADCIAVPVYPPNPARLSRDIARLGNIVRDARPSSLLTTSDILPLLHGFGGELPEFEGMVAMATDGVDLARSGDWTPPAIDPTSEAFLQYTSGSTGDPKGVRVSHANILHNERLIQEAFGETEHSVVIGWLPLYHDMGLIGTVLSPLHTGSECVLMSPASFLQAPVRWLRAISRYRGTTSAGPNFAYDLCVRKVAPAERESLDLRSWVRALNGAEPIRSETLARFVDAFAPCGFRREAFMPCYGLAEATLVVSGGGRGEPLIRRLRAGALERGRVETASDSEADARTLVGCGRPVSATEVVIVDSARRVRSAPEQVGEIWVRGDSVALGYFGRSEQSEQTFTARLTSGEGPFLRTGDLGFLTDGHLFITGRAKDLIIVAGRNVYPQDLEQTVERAHSAVRPGCVAAFSTNDDSTERIVIAAEVDLRSSAEDLLRELALAIVESVGREHELAVASVVLLERGNIPKTSSGKIQRARCRAAYLANELTVLSAFDPQKDDESREAPVTESEGIVARAFAESLSLPLSRVGRRSSFIALGGDSLRAIELTHLLKRNFGATLSMQEVFECSTVVELARRLETATPTAGSDDEPVLEEVGDRGCLSSAQQQLWFLQQLDPSDVSYNLQRAFFIGGPIDVEALGRAIRDLVIEQPVLRLRFTAFEGRPHQYIDQITEPLLELRECTVAEDEDFGKVALQTAASDLNRAFDLSREAPFRALLYRGRANEHLLVLVAHHLVMDGRSLELAMDRIARGYRVHQRDSKASTTLDASSRETSGYLGYAAWQQSESGRRGWSNKRARFRERLQGAPTAIDLPFAGPRRLGLSPQGRRLSIHLADSIRTAVVEFARRHETTPYVALLSAHAALLHRYSGQDDLVIGCPFANRARPEFAEVVGLFVNTLPIRVDLSERPTFSDLSRRVRQAILEAHHDQDLPLDQIVAEIAPGRALGRTPLFDTLFSFQRAPTLRLVGLDVREYPIPVTSVKFGTSLVFEDCDHGWEGAFEHRLDVLDPEMAARMGNDFIPLLVGGVTDPNRRLHRLRASGSREQAALSIGAAGPSNDTKQSRLIHHRFRERARERPQAIAVRAADGELSYNELDRRSDRAAAKLQELGVGPDDVVAIAAERSTAMTVWMMGALKAGGAYAAIEPHPVERWRRLIDQLAPRVQVSRDDLADSNPRTPFLDFDSIDDATSVTTPIDRASPSSLAYVLFTSGSTGIPKAVGVEHRQLCNYVDGVEVALDLPRQASFVSVTSPSTDLGNTMIFPALTRGGTLHLLGEDIALAPERMAEMFVRFPIDALKTTPSHLAALLSSPRAADLLPKQRLVLGGERLSRSLMERLGPLLPAGCRVFNHYGPTETTVGVLTCELDPKELSVEPPLGRPIANVSVHVIDDDLVPCPVGVPGEICIGGASVARGYLGEPGATSAKFVPDPFSANGGKLYRTGDLGRRRPDGTIEFMRRIDDQIKLRGFRIELGEIEAALTRHPSIREAAISVVARPSGPALVAYVVSKRTQEDSATLRSFLATSLPDAMIPSQIVFVESLPRTASGKLDKRALPPLPDAPATEMVPAQTETERVLASIYSTLLGVEAVGREHHFFELGGHSLLATQLVSRVQSAFGLEVRVADVFEAPRIRALAERIEARRSTLKPSEVNGAGANPTRSSSFVGGAPSSAVSFAQRRLWFLSRLDPSSVSYNGGTCARLRGPLDVGALQAAVSEVERRHSTLRTTFVERDGEPIAVVHDRPLGGLSVVNRRGVTDARWRAHVRGELNRPYDLSKGPLVRTLLVELDELDHVLAVGMHHIVSDAWSTAIWAREVSVLYDALRSGRASPLSELSVSYSDFAAWQTRWLSGPEGSTQQKFWRNQLADLSPQELPLDRPRTNLLREDAGSLPFRIAPDQTAALRSLSQRADATLFMTLVGAFQCLLARWTQGTDVAIGVPIANRSRTEFESLIGFFVNTLVLRTQLDDDPTFATLLARVRETMQSAYAHQDFPFERIVQELSPVRELGRAPLIQTWLGLQSAPVTELSLDDVSVERVPLGPLAAKFDLALLLNDANGELSGEFEFRSDLFDARTIDLLATRFSRLLEAVCQNPQLRLSQLPFLDDRERERLLIEWNDTTRPFDVSHSLMTRIEDRARSIPDVVALQAEDETFTYRELDERSNQLARHLVRRGIGPESRVAVFLERSANMVIALHAILKAGGAYVPLDPTLPAERLAFMIAQSRSALLLYAKNSPWLEAEGCFSTLNLDEHEAWQSESIDSLGTRPQPKSAAYVIYTSGSTGQPKGVTNVHEGLLNRLLWMQEAYPLDGSDVVVQKTPFGFDVSVWEFFWPFLAGARLVVAKPGGHRDPAYLIELIQRHRVTTIHFVPSMLRAFLDHPHARDCRSLRRVFASGEALSADLRDRFFAEVNAELHNLYGPTEASIDVSSWTCRREDRSRTVPIGRPIANVELRILDRFGALSPVGVPGELHIGGVALARGYEARPDLTAERFVPDPFGSSGARLYRTGDLARWTSDGTIEYLGRLDHQIKLNGFRIELEEIEATLRAHPLVRDVVVVARSRGASASLVGYLVLAEGHAVEKSEESIRIFAATRLPEYMLPGQFVWDPLESTCRHASLSIL